MTCWISFKISNKQTLMDSQRSIDSLLLPGRAQLMFLQLCLPNAFVDLVSSLHAVV